jgi:hypothetical protein
VRRLPLGAGKREKKIGQKRTNTILIKTLFNTSLNTFFAHSSASTRGTQLKRLGLGSRPVDVTIEAVVHKCEVLILLTVAGKGTIASVRDAIIEVLEDSDVGGDIAEGPWKIAADESGIAFENDRFGASISIKDIERALKTPGQTIAC